MAEADRHSSIEESAAHDTAPLVATPGLIPVTRLWLAFVLGWLLVLVVVVGLLVQERSARPRLAVGCLGMALLAGLYLWVTLREAIGPSDLLPGGPGARALRRRIAFLGAMALLVVGLAFLLPGVGAWWLAMHVIVAAGLVLPATLAGWTIGATILTTIGGAWLASGRPDPMLLILIAFGAAAVAIRQLTISLAQLRAAREALARAAVDQERLRFARDLHDLLGHTLSLIILKSELAGRLLPASPTQAALEIADVERAARDAMRQAREAAAGYRQPVLRRELDAARELLAAADIAAVVVDSTGPLDPALDGLLGWAIREGVTNVIRHSRAEHCQIRVARLGDLIELAVTDDGAGGMTGSSRPGHGLAGLAERAAPHGGELHAGAQPEGGFRLLLRVPATREAQS